MLKFKFTPKKKFLAIFVLLNILLSVFFIDTWSNWNSVSRALPIMAYFEQGNFVLDKYNKLTGDISFINGHYYTDKAPMATMIVLPFYKVLVSTGIIKRHNSEADLIPIYIVAAIVCGSIPFVLLLFFMMRELIDRKTHISPVIMVMLPVYGSLLFVFAGTFFSHLLAGILVLGAYLALKNERFFLAGILTGLAFATEFPLGIFVPVWGLIILIKELSLKKTVFFGLGTLPFILFILYYNYYFTGSPFTMLYKYEVIPGFAEEFTMPGTIFGFAIPRPENLWEMMFGQYKGLLFHMPVLFLILIHFYNSLTTYNFRKISINYFVIPVIVFVLLIVSKSIGWWGGWTYGPRYLIPACVLIAYEGIVFLSKTRFYKSMFYFLGIFGLLCAWIAKATVVTSVPSLEQFPFFSYILQNFLKSNFNPNNIMTMLFDTHPGIAAYCWLFLYTATVIWLVYLHKKITTDGKAQSS